MPRSSSAAAVVKKKFDRAQATAKAKTKAKPTMAIVCASADPVIAFAASELARCLGKATGWRFRQEQTATAGNSGKSAGKAGFLLGLAGAVGVPVPAQVKAGDDWVSLRGSRKSGYVLAGSNPRSVLFAVYRYLQACGVRFLRPGPRGEWTPPQAHPLLPRLSYQHAPSYRYRTICIEGASSRQHILDLIDWQTKQGMNGYFIQFEYGTIFFRRWYEHRNSKYLKPEPADEARIKADTAAIIAQLQQRGLSFERMGHGWTCAAMGISGEVGWDQSQDNIVPESRRHFLAQVEGKRELWKGVALNTNLDYGNPEVRQAMTDAIVAYAREHPMVDLLHFWLADGANNHDEGAASSSARPSDFYVMMLNELDVKLAAAGLRTRIVFLIYVDLLWPPVREKIVNPERFVLMFAPITRTYLRAFTDAEKTEEKPVEYVRNKLAFPRSATVNIEYLRQWQQQFPGDGFDFDYHVIWALYYDFAQFTLARTLHRDIQGLAGIGLQGLNSCQVQRVGFPHNLLMDVTARALWDRKQSFARIVADTFGDAFGKPGPQVAAAFTEISRLWAPFFEPVYLPERDGKRIARGQANLPKIAKELDRLALLVKKNLPASQGARRWSWRYVQKFVELLRRLLPAFADYLAGAPTMRKKLERATDWMWRQEKLLHPGLDCFNAGSVLNWRANELEGYLKGQSKSYSPMT